MVRLKSRMAPALVRYDSPGRISQAEAAELANCIPPLQAALAAAAKTQRKKQLWFTACIPSARPLAPSLTSGGSGSYSGKDSPESPRSTMSDAPCHRLCSAEVCPLPPSEPAPSYSGLRSAASAPAKVAGDLHVLPTPDPRDEERRAPAPQAVPEIVPLSPRRSSHSGPQPVVADPPKDITSEVAISGGRSRTDLRILFPKVKQLFVNGAASLKMKTTGWHGKRQEELAANEGRSHESETPTSSRRPVQQEPVPEGGEEDGTVGDADAEVGPGGQKGSE